MAGMGDTGWTGDLTTFHSRNSLRGDSPSGHDGPARALVVVGWVVGEELRVIPERLGRSAWMRRGGGMRLCVDLEETSP